MKQETKSIEEIAWTGIATAISLFLLFWAQLENSEYTWLNVSLAIYIIAIFTIIVVVELRRNGTK